MGLFSFVKKKETLSQPSQPSFDLNQVKTDLPPIDGNSLANSLGNFNSNNNFGNSFNNDSPDNNLSNNNFRNNSSQNKGLPQPSSPMDSVNIPPLDFQLPNINDGSLKNPQDSFSQNQMFSKSQQVDSSSYDLTEDINRLFPADEEWKEPEWSSFDPYQEPQIEAPEPKDFGMENGIGDGIEDDSQSPNLPNFDNMANDNGFSNNDAFQQSNSSNISDAQDDNTFVQNFTQRTGANVEQNNSQQMRNNQKYAEQFEEQSTNQSEDQSDEDPAPFADEEDGTIERKYSKIPMELYVKGSDYKSVFSEITRINVILDEQDPKINMLEDYTKQEDSLLLDSKNNMELIHRKLMNIDKQLFG